MKKEETKESQFSIYQLKDGSHMREYHFESMESLKEHGLSVERANYELKYVGNLEPKTTLEDIFLEFNVNRPDGFMGHSLSVSDIIVMHRGGERRAYYVDSCGFEELEGFFQETKDSQEPEQIKVYFLGADSGNLVLFTDGVTVKSFDGAPGGIYEGIPLHDKDAVKKLRGYFAELSRHGGFGSYQDMEGVTEESYADAAEKIGSSVLVYPVFYSELEIVSVGVEHIHPHPDNPRKDLGDLSELSESMKVKGCLQNLTLVPIEGEAGEYYVVIGHRRRAAAELIGLMELPCVIDRTMDQREQVSTMMVENVLRSDLTVYEQAQGFQMMLDLGETKDTIAERTGFSKRTIQHRLNIAKLDQDELLKKNQDESFQLSFSDLYALEQVKNIETRNEILRKATDSRNLASRARDAAAEEKREGNKDSIRRMLENIGVEPAPGEGMDIDIYGNKWKIIEKYDLNQDVPEEITLPYEDRKMYWTTKWQSVYVIAKPLKEERQLSETEIANKAATRRKRRLREVLKVSSARRKELIENIINGKVKQVKNESKEIRQVWESLVALGAKINRTDLNKFFLDKDIYDCTEEERTESREKAEKLKMLHQMLVFMHAAMKETEPFDYAAEYKKSSAENMLKCYQALEPYGWYFENDEEKQVLEGDSGIYGKEDIVKEEKDTAA